MLAIVLIIGSATAAAVAVLLVAFLLVLVGLANMSPHQRMMRERRRHVQRTTRAMRRMSAIRRETVRRMDQAEGRRR
jgi:hypothetical protein